MALDVAGLQPLDTSGLKPTDTDSTPRLDVGGLKPLDVSGLKPTSSSEPAPTPAPSDDETSLSDYPVEFGKGFLEGAKNTVASAVKGTGALAEAGMADNNRLMLETMEKVDRGEPVREIDDVAGYQQMTPEQRAQARTQLEPMLRRPVNVQQNPLFIAGQAMEDFGKDTLAPRKGFEGRSWTRDIGGGFGSVATGIGAALLSPTAAGLMFVTAGSGQQVDDAVKAGASPEQIAAAARYGTIAGATDVVDALLPALGSTGKALGFIKRVGYGAVKGALAEGGQEGLQQFIQNVIARGLYDPDRDLMEDVPRNAAVGAIVGGTVSGAHAGAERHAPVVVAQQPLDNAIPADTILPADEDAGSPPPSRGSAPAVSDEAEIETAKAQVRNEILQEAAALAQSRGKQPPLPADPAGALTLKAMLEDPRSAEEMRAGIEKARQAEADAANWQASDEWQEVPQPLISSIEQDARSGTGFVETKTEGGLTYARKMPPAGSREAPVSLEKPEDVSLGAEQTAQPTPAQAEAGNYAKRQVRWQGLEISIETEAGQQRTGIGEDGKPWSTTMEHPYGYIKETEGNDGDHLDVYVGPDPQSKKVFVFDQVDPDNLKFDEHKIVIGARSSEEATHIYSSGFSDGTGGMRWGAVTEMTPAELKTWIKSGDTTKPLSYIRTPQPRGPVQNRGPLSLFQFLAKRGGIQDYRGELRSMDLHKAFVPGFGRLVRSKGMDLDTAREAAVEAGYIHDPGFNNPGVQSQTTIDSLLQALDQEARGERLYSQKDVQAVADRHAAEEGKRSQERLDQATDEARAIAGEQGLNATDEELQEAARRSLVNTTDLTEALVDVLEESAIRLRDELVELEPGADHAAAQPSGTDQTGARPAPASEHAAGPQAEAEAGRETPRVEPREAQRDQTPAEPADKHGNPLKVGDTVRARAIGGHEYEATIERFVRDQDGEPAADILTRDGKGRARPALAEIERVTRDNASSSENAHAAEAEMNDEDADEDQDLKRPRFDRRGSMFHALQSLDEGKTDSFLRDEMLEEGYVEAKGKGKKAPLNLTRKGRQVLAKWQKEDDAAQAKDDERRERIKARIEKTIEREPAESDVDYFLRLVNAHYQDHTGRTANNLSYKLIGPVLDKFSPHYEKHKIPIEKSAKVSNLAVSLRQTPAGWGYGIELAVPNSGTFTNANVWPHRISDDKIGYYKTRTQAIEAAVEDIVKRSESLATRVDATETEKRGMRRAIAVTREWEQTQLSGKKEPPPAEAKPAAAKAEASPTTRSDKSEAGDVKLARALYDRLQNGQHITAKTLQDEATKAFGGKMAEGKFDRKSAHDALELAVNMWVANDAALRVDGGHPKETITALGALLSSLPTQRVRSDEMISHDQFSTPPNYAAAAAYAAALREGDTVLEPSAGTGSLVAAASMPGVKIIANEFSERRAALLRDLMGGKGEVFTENAEQLDNILPDKVKPTVVLMNPPFSATAGRMGEKKDANAAAVHIKQALDRLEPGGRLVAIVGQGMTMGAPRFRAFWNEVKAESTVRANIGVDGKVFEKYGTTYGTRVFVIDKVKPPEGHEPVLADAQTVEDLMRALEPIRNERAQLDAKQPTAEPRRADVAEGAGGQTLSERPAARGAGVGERSDGGVAGPRSRGAGEPSQPSLFVEAGKPDGVAPGQSERTGERGAGTGNVAERGERSDGEGSRRDRSQRDLQQDAGGQPGAAASGERVSVENAAPTSQAATEAITESLYENYTPQRVRIAGAKPHPGPLVESASMSSVSPPAVKYKPALPKKLIEEGGLSLAQLEPIIYAGQAHAEMLPADGDTPTRRRGYFIGDGTGVGKGREGAGIILDNWLQGRTKAVWVSEKKTLMQDAKRDWKGLGQDPNVVFDVGKTKTGEKINAGKGIGFITYDTLKGGMSDQAALARGAFVRKQRVELDGKSATVLRYQPVKNGEAQVTVKLENGAESTVPASRVTALESTVQSRVDQIVEWLGPDFDGVINFDEAHNMGNAAPSKGDRGPKDAAQKALAGIALQERLPNARVVYVSATGATEVSNLAYADRLGLWGRGTAFESREKFVSEVEKGGIAAMELIARDMKSLGLYTARNLSFEGVEYARLEHTLDENQREIYDTLAEAWQMVLRNINAALEETEGELDGRAKGAALSAFWGGHQRFFNQIVTSLQMPSVLKDVEADLKAGRQAVMQLTNTNEASQERAAAKATSAEEIEDLDITPRDQIIQLVERSFPTQQYERFVDDNGKDRSRPVVDSEGRPVQNKQAVRMREELIERLASVRVPQGPLDMLLDHFGSDVVAEVTGRGRRFVMKTDEQTGQRRRMEESRPGSANVAETDAFQGGKKKILVFSEAGGTGRSYHADNTAVSKNARRSHYLLQAGWRADKAVQGFGRTHRTNQASAPIVKLVTTNLQGQKRFISSIARRLAQLGALTKGQRQAGDQGVFSARDNLESTEATIALRQFYSDLLANKIEGLTVDAFEEQTGLDLRSRSADGASFGNKAELPPITTFLNRLLSLTIAMQDRVFNAFSTRLDSVIEAREQAGLLDAGLETVKADKITKDSEQVVHTAPESGAETKYVKLTVADRFEPADFKDVAGSTRRPIVKWVTSPNGKVYGVADASSLTDEKGKIVDQYRVISPVSESRVVARSNIDGYSSKWNEIKKADAEARWQNEIEAAPEFVTRDMHLITGAILPVWDRLKGSTRVVRLQTDAGERFLGRVVPNGSIAPTLKALGAEAATAKLSPGQLFDKLTAGARARLSNGWSLRRSLVAGEQRIELIGPTSFSEGTQVKQDGVFTERIEHKLRYFVPNSAEGKAVLEKLTQYRPVAELVEPGARPSDAAAGDDPMYSLADRSVERELTPAGEIRTIFTGKFAELADKVYPALRAELDRIGLKDVGLTLADRVKVWSEGQLSTADGVFYQDAITLALEGNAAKTLQHEALHALRRAGVFTDAEWSILSRASEARWRKQFSIDERYSAFPEWVKTEEGVAHAFAAWSDGKLKVDGRIARLFNRIESFFEALGNALRGQGFKTAEDVFSSIERGDMAHRQPRGENGQWASDGKVAFAIRSGDGDLFKTEVVETPDGPREQYIIPGAEKIGDGEKAQRGADDRLRGKKTQKDTDGLPLFGDRQGAMFSLQREPGTAVEAQRIEQGFIARGQPLDRAVRLPFDLFGGMTRDGQWKPGMKIFDGAARAIVNAKFSDRGRFAFANPILETARAGLIDRYTLRNLPEYVDRERARSLDERAVMLQGAEILKSLKDHGVGKEEARVLQSMLTGEEVSEGDMGKLAEPIRAAIDQLGQEAVALGLVSAESFERNRGTYLHRVYEKYEADQNGLNRFVNQIMSSRRKKIIGDQFRGRGLFKEVALPRLMKDVPGWVEAERGTPENGEKFVILDDMAQSSELELDESQNPEKTLRRIYWPADKEIPDRYSAFRNQGVWEVRGTRGGKLVLWRDFTKAEREQMGEILDARYTIGKTFMLMAHDLANGRFYKDIAENEAWAHTSTPNTPWIDADEWRAAGQRLAKRGDLEWVKVPETEIPNSGGKKRWGALSGKWVREEIWRDLNEQEIMSRPGVWRSLLTQWKLNKTARSPVVHMNNVLSNFVLMDLIDVRAQDLVSGVRSYLTQDQHYRDAFQEGAFGADMISQEVRDQVLRPLLEEITKDNTYNQGGRLGALGQVSQFTEALWSKFKTLDDKMKEAYRIEDELFRMATYLRRRELGDDTKQAAAVARDQFIDYDIRAPWINTVRNSVLPFISYTYRAAPLVARAIATRPWKLGKYFLLAYLANSLAYWFTGDDDEDRERRSFREKEQGQSWIGAYNMTRMPWNDSYNNPVFLDTRRWVPAGDVYDMADGDLPPWLNLGGPLMIGAELFLNRSAFTKKEIVNDKTDNWSERMMKRGDHLYKSWMPSAAWVPNSWYWEKIATAAQGGTDRQGRPYSVPSAVASSVGIKFKAQDVQDAMSFKAYEFSQIERELNAEANRLADRQARKIISESEFNKAMARILDKKQRLAEKARETLKESPRAETRQ